MPLRSLILLIFSLQVAQSAFGANRLSVPTGPATPKLCDEILDILNPKPKFALAETPPEPTVFREEVRLREPFSMRPFTTTIGPELIGHTSVTPELFRRNQDVLTVNLFPLGSPSFLAQQGPRLFALDGRRVDPNLQISGSATTSQASASPLMLPGKSHALIIQNQTLVQQNNYMTRFREMPPARQKVEIQDAVADYIAAEMSQAYLPPTVLQTLISSLHRDPETVSRALAFRAASQNMTQVAPAYVEGRFLPLSADGRNSYFAFTPDGHHKPVYARVLDIHNKINPSEPGHIILVEWLEEPAAEGLRVRHVRSLSLREVQSINVSQDAQRDDAAQAFLESLSSAELLTLEMARKAKIRTYGFSDYTRRHQRDSATSGSEEHDPLSTMSRINAWAHTNFILKNWKSIENLMTAAEKEQQKNQAYWTAIDVFARLTPSYVVEHFKSPQSIFAWILTQDGQLKMMPYPSQDFELPPPLLRLAHGRRAFVGGFLWENMQNQWEVRLSSQGYEFAPSGTSAHNFAGDEGQDFMNLMAFVGAAFRLQTRIEIEVINRHRHESILQAADRLFAAANAEWKQFRYRQKPKSGFRPTSPSAPPEIYKTITWGDAQSGDAPLYLTKWIKATERPDSLANDPLTQITWAHYVLKTTMDMSDKDVKMAYRKLLLGFGSLGYSADDKQKTEFVQTVNRAFDLLDTRIPKGHTP
ncbi:MAG: hypothetical protein AB7N80_11130 [Bdellovibrionales bacterium]